MSVSIGLDPQDHLNKLALRPPKRFRSLLRFREELERLAVENACTVTFGGMLDRITIKGEEGHVDRFLVVYGVWLTNEVAREQR